MFPRTSPHGLFVVLFGRKALAQSRRLIPRRPDCAARGVREARVRGVEVALVKPKREAPENVLTVAVVIVTPCTFTRSEMSVAEALDAMIAWARVTLAPA